MNICIRAPSTIAIAFATTLCACTSPLTPRTFCGPTLPPCQQPLVCTDPDGGGVCVPDSFASDAGSTDGGAIDGGSTSSDVLSISNFAPQTGSSLGFTNVTISGSGFLQSGVAVRFGATSAPTVNVVSDVALAVVSPPHARGTVNIVVESNWLDASATAATPFTYYDPVVVLSLAPDAGRAVGGDIVTIYGTGFIADSGVTFGGSAAQVISIDPDGGSIQARTPAGFPYDPVDVVVSNYNGASMLTAAFDYYSTLSTVAGGGSGDGTQATMVSLGSTVFGAVSPDGRVYVSATDLHRIYRIEPDGRLVHVVGSGGPDSGMDGLALTTDIASPRGLAFSDAGELYFAEYGGHRVRKLFNGGIVTVAGNGVAASNGDNGPATNASVATPFGLAFDGMGRLLITERSTHVVRRLDTNGNIAVVAGTRNPGFSANASIALNAAITWPTGIVEWPAGTGEFVFAESGNGVVRHVDSVGGTRILLGGGQTSFYNGINARSAHLPDTMCVARGIGTTLLVSQFSDGGAAINRSRIFLYDGGIDGGSLSLVAGTGTPGSSSDGTSALAANLWSPCVFSNASGLPLFTESRQSGARVRTIDAGFLVTVGGSGPDGPNFFGDNGPATLAGLSQPYGVAYDTTTRSLYIGDSLNHRIRAVTDDGGIIATFAGNGDAGYTDAGTVTSALLRYPYGVVVNSTGTVHFADTGNHRIRSILSGSVLLLAGNGASTIPASDTMTATQSPLNTPRGVAVAADGTVFVADMGNHVVRQITPQGLIIRFAGRYGIATSGGNLGDNGDPMQATLYWPTDVAIDSAGNVYIADSFNNRVRRVIVDAGVVIKIETVIGNGSRGTTGDNGPAVDASVSWPTGVCVDAKDWLYVAERYGYVVRRVARNDAGVEIARVVAGRIGVTGFSGDGFPSTVATLSDPADVECGPDGVLYVTEPGINRVRIIR